MQSVRTLITRSAVCSMLNARRTQRGVAIHAPKAKLQSKTACTSAREYLALLLQQPQHRAVMISKHVITLLA